MDKIYRRRTQTSGTEKKKKNEKNRARNVIMNFRVSAKEKELIEARVAMSGLPKAEFFIESCLYQAILVKGNIKTFTEIKNKITQLEISLKEDNDLSKLEPAQIESLRIILEILDSVLKKEE